MAVRTRMTESPVLHVFNRGCGHLVGFLGRDTGLPPGLRLHKITRVQQQKQVIPASSLRAYFELTVRDKTVKI